MALTRREFIGGLAGLFATAILPCEAIASDRKRKALLKAKWGFEQDSLESLVLLADAYKEKGPKPLPNPITVLYPGSGTDVNMLEVGARLLYETPINHARFIFTEIGEYDDLDFAKANHWHEGRRYAVREIEKALTKNQPKVFKRRVRKMNTNMGWQNPSLPNSTVTGWDLSVQTPAGGKKVTLYFCYNTIRDREEPTQEEQQAFTNDLILNARRAYWPKEKKPGKMYPTYFLQAQFDQADIIISKQCGDLGLLQFDYVRAFHRTTLIKPRAVLTESVGTNDVMASLKGYNVQRHTVESNSEYGYCLMSNNDCQMAMLVISKS